MSFLTYKLLLPCCLDPCLCQCSPYRHFTTLVAYFSPLSVLLLLYLLLNILQHYEKCLWLFQCSGKYRETQTGDSYPAIMSTFFVKTFLFFVFYLLLIYSAANTTLVLSWNRKTAAIVAVCE